MTRLAALSVILELAVLGACGSSSDTIVSPPPATLTIIAGNNQSANVRGSLSDPLAIAVTTPDGAGVAGVAVQWTVTKGGGTLSASSVLTDGQGRASVIWTLGDAAGNQSVAATGTGLVGSPVNFSASATAPIVLHYDGTAWTTALEDVNGARASLASIWGATASAVFAVGGSCNGSLALQYDGTAWSQLPPSCVGTSLAKTTSVWGSSASDVFATYIISLPPRAGGNILHYDGQQWRSVYALPCPSGILCPAYKAVWSSSLSDAFAVGAGGMIGHYDGTNWNPQASGTTGVLNAVWGVGPAGAVFAVGGGGTILYYDRTTWRAQTSGTSQPLYAVWGTSANDVFAVGESGTILHYDGTAWTAQNSGTPQPLYGIWGSSSNAVFAVGGASTIVYYDGAQWSAQTTSASMNLSGVWGSSPVNVFAVGAPR